jgi:hypothetical protein
MTRDEIIRRGDAAARVLGDDIAMAALAEIASECTSAWASSNPADAGAREDAYRMQRCAMLIRQKLEAWRGAAQIEKGNAARRLSEARSGAEP